LISDVRIALLSRPIILILSGSIALRILFQFFILPSGLFVPDEGNYALLAKYVSIGLPVSEYPGYGAPLYHSTKSLILPSALLIELGVNEISSVRAVSSFYGFASSLMLAMTFIAFRRLRQNDEADLHSSISQKKFIVLLFLFTFFPSVFLWSILGLRESASQFWIITTFYFLLKYYKESKLQAWKFGTLAMLSLIFSFSARPQTATVFAIVISFFTILFVSVTRRFSLLIFVTLGFLTGQTYSSTPSAQLEKASFSLKLDSESKDTTSEVNGGDSEVNGGDSEVNGGESEVNGGDDRDNLCTLDGQVIKIRGKNYICNKKEPNLNPIVNALKATQTQLKSIKRLSGAERNENSLGANSALPISKCEQVLDFVPLVYCNLTDLPYRIFAFLFRPLLLFDQGSSTLSLATLENLIWIVLVPVGVWFGIRKEPATFSRIIKYLLMFYFIMFSAAASLHEGNLGTAFRHKSSILWVILFILMIDTKQFLKFKENNNRR
jgi:hypothetical protein